MIPNRQNPAYSLFARRPIVHSRGMSSLRIHLPAWNRSRRPVTKTLPTECPLPARRRIKIRRQYKHCTRGVWPANFERLRETKDLSALAHT